MMNFDEIRLPPAAIAEMYAGSLVLLPGEPERQPPPVEKISPPLPFLGKNLKNITVLVNYPSDTYLPEEQLSFVGNIFKACGMDTDDLAIVNTARLEANLQTLKTLLSPAVMLVFGTHDRMAMPASEHFALTKTENTSVVSLPELEKLNRQDPESRLLKSRLWLTLKLLFNV